MREETKIKIQLARIIQNKMSSSYKRIVEFYLDDIQVIDWLIEQAEKVELLQQETEKEQKRLRNQIYETVEEKFLLEKQLQQAQAKAERYEKALKEIAEWSGIASREYRIATKALEGKENE